MRAEMLAGVDERSSAAPGTDRRENRAIIEIEPAETAEVAVLDADIDIAR